MPDPWDSEAGRTHSVGDGCVPAHQALPDELHQYDSTGHCNACGQLICRAADRLSVEQRNQEVQERMDAPFRDMSETGASPAPDDERAKRRERLAGALKEADAATSLIHLVHIGAYDNFRSTNTNPDDQNLTSHASKAELWDIVRRAQAGEFDAPENY